RDLSDHVIAGIGNVEIVRHVGGEPLGIVELCGSAGSVLSASHSGGAGERRDSSIGCDLADRVIASIGDVEHAGSIDGYASRIVEARGSTDGVRRAAEPGTARNRGHDARRGNLADSVTNLVGNVGIAVRIAGETRWVVEAGRAA